MALLERARALEAEGRRIVHMEIGEPDFPTPPPVVEAARRGLEQDGQWYTPSTGAPALQRSIADFYRREYDVTVEPERILITPGSSGAFTLLYAALLEPGDRVLLPDPGYPCQRNLVRLAGGEPVNIPVDADSRYHLSAERLFDHWSDRCRAAVVVSPGNPTGTLIDPEALAGLAAACRRRGGWLISDEIYHGLTYGCRAQTALAVDARAIVVNSFSKRWAMTGWRVGWLIVPPELIDPCRRVMQNIFIAAPTLSQQAAITALGCRAEVEAMRRAYDARRRYLLEALPPLGFEIVVAPQGAFYIYADVSRITDESGALCRRLLEQAGVAVTPGADFGRHRAARHVRFSYATDMESLKLGVERIARFLGGGRGG
ncbi:MAG: aminotransferase class I/II-fold pyridoxal phosphate-dependent enzyme [Zetaproteobacteria bacterium]|nr:MAG: aminotransferase class I/II-fold pyridoxal phosphate-dependent enzyme [Zetaproteobacteria bacterium]